MSEIQKILEIKRSGKSVTDLIRFIREAGVHENININGQSPSVAVKK